METEHICLQLLRVSIAASHKNEWCSVLRNTTINKGGMFHTSVIMDPTAIFASDWSTSHEHSVNKDSLPADSSNHFDEGQPWQTGKSYRIRSKKEQQHYIPFWKQKDCYISGFYSCREAAVFWGQLLKFNYYLQCPFLGFFVGLCIHKPVSEHDGIGLVFAS